MVFLLLPFRRSQTNGVCAKTADLEKEVSSIIPLLMVDEIPMNMESFNGKV